LIQSFQPIIGNKPKILILGTLPSIKSLELKQYYGNPHNSFWKIIFTIFKQDYSSSYNDKKSLVIRNNIAIWDVCHSANRSGSLDSKIQDVIPNKIDELIQEYPTINKIGFNGQTAAILYEKYFTNFENIKYLKFLSTSPANARYNFQQKLENWSHIL